MIKKALDFLSLTDNSGNLSISNIAVIVCVVKLTLVAQASLPELGALLVTLINYAHKRAVNNDVQN